MLIKVHSNQFCKKNKVVAFFKSVLNDLKYIGNCINFRMEFHNSELKKVCRVCGRRLKKAKKERERSYMCARSTSKNSVKSST